MKTFGGIIGVVALATYRIVALPVFKASAAEFDGTESLRKGRWEVLLSPQYTLGKNLGFTGGTTAKIDDTFGFGFQLGYNLNEPARSA